MAATVDERPARRTSAALGGLRGREAEADVVAALLERVHSGSGAALVIRGEAGIGKTTLLGLAGRAAPDMTVLRATAIETEAELPFAGLHLLLRPVLGLLPGIAGPQARALERAFGLAAGQQPPGDAPPGYEPAPTTCSWPAWQCSACSPSPRTPASGAQAPGTPTGLAGAPTGLAGAPGPTIVRPARAVSRAPPAGRCSALSTTHSGWTARPRRRCCSRPAGSTPTASPSSSRCATPRDRFKQTGSPSSAAYARGPDHDHEGFIALPCYKPFTTPQPFMKRPG